MELLILKLVAVLRPLASIKYLEAAFDVLGVGLIILLLAALVMRGAVHKTLTLSAIDLLIVGFGIWCFAIYVIYFEAAQVRYVFKLLIPLFSYIVVKNIVHERADYMNMLFWLIVASSIPVLVSAGLILAGSGIDRVNYWTGVVRYEGAYVESHSFGHSMTLFLMMLVVYFGLLRDHGGAPPALKWAAAGVAAVALYCLYMSQVRSAIVGLIVFAAVYLYFLSKKWLLIGAVAASVIAVTTVSYWLYVLVPELEVKQRGMEVNVMELGSGRPTYWLHDLKLYLDLPIDQKIAGVGIGTGDPAADQAVEYKLYGHNDWLDILTQTGLVGFSLFALLQILVFRSILGLSGRERYLFLALFLAVTIMMFVSNSYMWRIQVSQIYYMILAFLEIAPRESRSRAGEIHGVPRVA